jgi:hypothetical protein
MTTSIPNPSIRTAAPPRRRYLTCAAEHRPAYLPTHQEATSRPDGPPTEAADDGSTTETVGDGGLPGGRPERPVEPAAGVELTARLPVLAEVPDLADALSDLTAADAALRRAVIALGKLDDALEVEQVTGVGLEHWLALACHHSRLERRTLLRTARWTRRLPAFAAALETGALSWAQARTLTLVLRELPAGHDHQADQLLGQLTATLPDDADPDAIADQLRRACFRWRDELTPDHDPVPGNRLTIQPRLDGTGGSFHGDADAVGLAILDDATAPRRDQLDHPGGIAGARADNLLARLLHHCPDQPDTTDNHDHDSTAPDHAANDHAGRRRRRAPDGTTDRRPWWWVAAGRAARTARPRHRARHRPVPARAVDPPARRQAPRHHRRRPPAARHPRRQVAHRARRPRHRGRGRTGHPDPARLPADAVLAIHDTCTGPVCDRPARGADVDHAAPWHPIDDRPPGTTDLDDLGPLCDRPNRDKEAAGWRAHPAGLRTDDAPGTTPAPACPSPPSPPPGDHRTSRRRQHRTTSVPVVKLLRRDSSCR